MAGLSLTTVVLSLLSDCPSFLFYILEVIVNVALVAEVGIRFVAFGRQFWSSWCVRSLLTRFDSRRAGIIREACSSFRPVAHDA